MVSFFDVTNRLNVTEINLYYKIPIFDKFRFDYAPGIEIKLIFSRFSRAHFPIEMNKHKIGKITTQKLGLDISTLMYAS